MTRDNVIEMAKEVGIEWDLLDEDEGQIWYIATDDLLRFAKQVAAHEREACAKVCETLLGPTATEFYGKTYAAVIRKRDQNES